MTVSGKKKISIQDEALGDGYYPKDGTVTISSATSSGDSSADA